jgi:hypothetical protein
VSMDRSVIINVPLPRPGVAFCVASRSAIFTGHVSSHNDSPESPCSPSDTLPSSRAPSVLVSLIKTRSPQPHTLVLVDPVPYLFAISRCLLLDEEVVGESEHSERVVREVGGVEGYSSGCTEIRRG